MCQDASIPLSFQGQSPRGSRETRRLAAAAPPARFVLISLIVLGLAPPAVYGDVQSIGNVIPARNPFDPMNEPGLPVFGNFINPFEEPNPENPSAENQTNFEGEADIIVGESSFGAVLISGNTHLRYQDLIIGDMDATTTQPRFGTGVVRISGFGALFNNDPTILPFGLLHEEFGSKRDPAVGFDLFVGRNGFGTLEISAGGRAEIQDAVVVGDAASAVGNLFVTGFDSFLGSGGFDGGTGGIGTGTVNQMIIGRLGTGFLQISEGGQVLALSPTGGTQQIRVAAVVGGDSFNRFGDNQAPRAGGQGTVDVDGAGSRWTVGGTLQVGGFHLASAGVGEDPDLAGQLAQYSPTVGRGTLNVTDGGLVTVLVPTEATTGAPPVQELNLLVGRFGRVNLDDGRINVLGGFQIGDDPNPLIDDVNVINDGVISGSGYISTSRFRNRVLGEVRVAAGQKLVIDSVGRVTATLNEEPLVNYGLMQAIGNIDARAELEFERAPPDPASPDAFRPLVNQRLMEPPANGGRAAGLIHGQWSHLRFRSGLANQGQLAFTAGDNVVSGNVVNLGPAEAEDNGDEIGQGVITISGNGTTVVFEDDLMNFGTINVGPSAAQMTVLGDFINFGAGTLAMTLGGGATGSAISHLSVGGSAALAGTLEVDLFQSGANPIMPMEGDRYEIITAAGGVLGTFDSLMPPPGVNMFAEYGVNTVTLVVGPGGGGPGGLIGDYNGDGVVDAADFTVWRDNLGGPGASLQNRDPVNGGNISQADYNSWKANFGAMAGAGTGTIVGAPVPEPTGLALLLSGGLLGLAWRRRIR